METVIGVYRPNLPHLYSAPEPLVSVQLHWRDHPARAPENAAAQPAGTYKRRLTRGAWRNAASTTAGKLLSRGASLAGVAR